MAVFVAEKSGAEVRLTSSGPTKKCYEISVAGERLKVLEEKWVKVARENAQLPGFRRGHVTEAAVMGQLGGWIKEKTSHEILSSVVDEIVRKENLKLVYNPVISKVDYKFGETLKFEADFEIEPVITLKSYKNLSLERRSKPVTDEEVDRELGRVLGEGHFSYLKPVDEPVREYADLWVLADIAWSVGDESTAERRTELFSVDEEIFPSGLTQVLAGMKAGETKSWESALDEDCPVAGWTGKKLKAQVHVLEVKRLENLDHHEENFKEHMPKWKEEIRQALSNGRERNIRRHLEDQITGELLIENPIEVPQAEVKTRTEELLQRAKTIMAMSGRQIADEHIEELRVKYAVQAANEIRFAYLVREIARRETIRVSEDDYNKKLETARDEKEKEFFIKNKESVLYDILTDKAFDFLIANAKVVDVEG
ncbi:MAG: hypothetical protein HY401_05320 [Elusimicrobia bacterium]|nr:hypothetical protein [Elusimicrobiota bacterium]